MGACASGAQDAYGFASAMAGGYMPEVDTMTFQGVFNGESCDAMHPCDICPVPKSIAISLERGSKSAS